MKEDEVWSVTQLLAQLRGAVEREVGAVRVVGEVGSCKVSGSGHIYFTLKDEKAQLACVFYRFQAMASRVRLREGLRVELTGRATVWETRGSLQFTVERVREVGVGTLQQQFEEMKRRLEAEGLFAQERKRALPRYPVSIGLITSPTGAVIQDMRHRLTQRAPWVRAYLLPVQVQGKGAERGLAAAVRMWSDPVRYGLPEVDFIILARGGGSLEDLWCFNEEVLARAIAASRVPVVSAVGHETDFTIADFTADLRAPTPTAAIEMTTPDAATLGATLDNYALTLRKQLVRAAEKAQLRLLAVERSKLNRPLELLAPYAQRLDMAEDELTACCHRKLREYAQRVEVCAARLQPARLRTEVTRAELRLQAVERALRISARAKLEKYKSELGEREGKMVAASPQNALRRGFAWVRREDGTLLRRAADAPAGTRLLIHLSAGILPAQATTQLPREKT